MDVLCCLRRTKTGSAETSSVAGVQLPRKAEEGEAALGPVLIELFSSQGCKESTGAEVFLSKIGNDQEEQLPPVLVLAFHVEFWDYLGWKDPFASVLWSARQRSYCEALKSENIYTPQLIVQGRTQCMASTADDVLAAIRDAPRFPLPRFKATFLKPTETRLQVSVSGQLRFKVEGYDLDITVAIFESGHVTDCTAGANRGRVITNDFVVKGLEKACTVKDISARKTVTGKVTFNLWDGFTPSKCGLVMFFQKSPSMEIQGVLPLQLPDDI